MIEYKINNTVFVSDVHSFLSKQSDIRFIVTVTDYRLTQTPTQWIQENSTFSEATVFSETVDRVNRVICKPTYSIIKTNLTYNTVKQDKSDRYFILKPEVLASKRLENSIINNLSFTLDNTLSTSIGIDDD